MNDIELYAARQEIRSAVSQALGPFATHTDDLGVGKILIDPVNGDLRVEIERYHYDEPVGLAFTLVF